MIPIWRYPLMVLLVTLVVQEGSAQSRRHRHSSSTHHSQSPNELKKDLNDLKNKKAELQSQLKATKMLYWLTSSQLIRNLIKSKTNWSKPPDDFPIVEPSKFDLLKN